MNSVLRHIRSFVHEHDDVPAFHAAYIVSTFLAAAILHLGFFAVLIALHMCLDYVKYRDFYRFSIPTTLMAIFIESISDLALFFLSLTFAIYLSHDYMLSAVSGLLRSELTLLRAFGTILPRVRILEHFFAIFTNLHEYLHSVNPALRGHLSRAQYVSAIVLIVCLGLIALSTLLYAGHMDQLRDVIIREMSIRL